MNAIFTPHHNGSRPHLANEARPYNNNKWSTTTTTTTKTTVGYAHRHICHLNGLQDLTSSADQCADTSCLAVLVAVHIQLLPDVITGWQVQPYMSHFQLTVHRMKIERWIQKSLSSAAFTAHYLVNKRYKIIMLTYQANLKYYTRQTYLASFSDRLLTCTVLPGMSIRGVQPATDFHRLTFIDGLPLTAHTDHADWGEEHVMLMGGARARSCELNWRWERCMLAPAKGSGVCISVYGKLCIIVLWDNSLYSSWYSLRWTHLNVC